MNAVFISARAAQLESAAKEWTTPSHEEIDLSTVEPDEIGVNWFDPTPADETLINAIANAHCRAMAGAAAAADAEKYLEPTDMLGYLRLLFEPGDWFDIKLIHQTRKYKDKHKHKHKHGVLRAETIDNFMTLENALDQQTVTRLAARQDEGWNVYVSMNAFTNGLSSRKEKDVAAIRSVYVEFDENTQAGLDRIDADIEAGIVPQNDFLIISSVGKAYVEWRVKDFTVPQQKALNKALQERYGSDPQSVDAARVLRLPGTRNLKYEPNPIVVINNEGDHSERFTPADFKIEYVVPKPVNREAAPEAVQRRMTYYEQACQDAGVDAGELIAQNDGSYSYIVECPAWEQHTNKAKYDGSVWISPSGCISYACWHAHLELTAQLGAKPAWGNFYRPWLEQEAKDNGFQGILKFGDASEVPTDPNAYVLVNGRRVGETTEPEEQLDARDECAMSQEEIAVELEKDYPVIPLAVQGGPSWDDDILCGPVGDIIRKASEYSEAHPAGMYLDLLVALGNIFGRSAFFRVGDTHHYTNEFMVRVGASAKSRKGTGRDTVDALLKVVDPDWYRARIMSGFGSAEAIVNEIRDPLQQQIPVKKNGEMTFKTVIVPGVNDKRLCIREGEIASVFQLAAKTESRADIVLRDGWDGKELRNLVKGKSLNGISNSAVCLEPHISISGDTTKNELLRKLPPGSETNGFGNRFLFCYVYRTKKCPMGGPHIDWTSEIGYLHKVVAFARQQKYMPLSSAARRLFKGYYMDSRLELSGVAGMMTDRAVPHIRRLAMILALIDMSNTVASKHVKAARELWDYCQESAQYIFTGTTRDQSRIIDWVCQQTTGTAKTVTISDIVRGDLFQRHKKADWVKGQIRELVVTGRLVLTDDQISLATVKTGTKTG